MRIDYDNKEKKKLSDDSFVKVKCPKLVISQFKDTALHWLRLWN